MGTIIVRYGQADSDTYEKLQVFSRALQIVQTQYVEEVDDETLIYGAIKGMLSDLDPHSSFMPPKVLEEMQVETKGEFGGLGIQIGIKDRMLTVISPIEDTPAFRAGIKAGDKIIKIEGEPTKDMTLEGAVGIMRGEKGTDVTITVMRESLDAPKDYTITRDIIQIKSVKYRVLEGDIGYARVMQFQMKTGSELEDALKDFDDKGVKGIILDLRNNPGGLLTMAVDVAGMFLDKGTEVVYIKGRDEVKNRYHTRNRSFNTEIPVVVLVNEGSASASEIVAGALQDWGRAIIMGTLTFGKGSVQSVIELPDNSGLKITTAKYYTPKDRSIQNTGIEPDIEVKQMILGEAVTKSARNHMRMRERDLKGRLDNETTKVDDSDKAKPIGDVLDEPADETTGEDVGDKDAGGVDAEAADALDDMTKEERELAMIERDYQLQRAIGLLKGLSIYEGRKAATAK
jgi:carboxyl-terminal processing protease